MPLAERLLERQLMVVTGKGGVGKTTLAALLGRYLAECGRRVLLLETDPRESLHQLLGAAPSDGAIVPAGPRLWFQNLQPRAVIEDLVREKVPVSPIAKHVIASPVFQHFADGAPGLKEMATLGHALRLVRGEHRRKFDVVVLDAPATGHGASMLNAPLLLQDAIGGGQLSEMAAQLGEFVADPARCAVVIGALAEEMPVQEAIELVVLLRERMNRQPEAVVVNALYPAFPAKAPAAKGQLAGLLELWKRRREVNQRELKRLRTVWKGDTLLLPLLAHDRGPPLLEALGRELEGKLEKTERQA